jgi:SAM-dependent methyltransferase
VNGTGLPSCRDRADALSPEELRSSHRSLIFSAAKWAAMTIASVAGHVALSAPRRPRPAPRWLERQWARTTLGLRLLAFERTTRVDCWCGGALQPFPHHASYGVCSDCGTYVNTRPPTREAMRSLYTLDLYWRRKQVADGLPPIEKRTAHDLNDGRVDRWLRLVDHYAPVPGRAVEIGCAHGVMLKELVRFGWTCVGVEIDPAVARWTADYYGLDIRSGMFPDVELPSADLFLAFDVLEHVPDPQAFLAAAEKLLVAEGTAILQAPIAREDEDPPFPSRFQSAFDDVEHLWIFTNPAIRELAQRTGFHVDDFPEPLWPMGELAVLRKRA